MTNEEVVPGLEIEAAPPEDRTPDLDGPPIPDEGVIESVDFSSRNSLAADHHTQLCQSCGDVVYWNREHVLAMVRVFRDGGSGWFVRPRFCDRDCWAEWANRG